jgi:hypothetical protein
LALQEQHATRIIHSVEPGVDKQHAFIAAGMRAAARRRLRRKYNGRSKKMQRAQILLPPRRSRCYAESIVKRNLAYLLRNLTQY